MASRQKAQQAEQQRPIRSGAPKRQAAAKRQTKRGKTPVVRKHVNVRGEVLAVDLHRMECQFRLSDGDLATVAFSPEHENDVMTALREPDIFRLRVQGEGELRDGGLLRIRRISSVLLLPVVDESLDVDHRPIEEIAAELGKEIPQEEWDSLPDDLLENLDHYIYGCPKRK